MIMVRLFLDRLFSTYHTTEAVRMMDILEMDAGRGKNAHIHT
jgi:hypothetical protein